MTIRINGLGSSGLDIDTLVSQMMQAKRVPIDKMKQKMTYLGWQRDAYRSMNTDMSSFMNEAQKLTLQSTFLAKKVSMATSDSDKVQVTAAPNALTGNFSLKVTQLAKSATITGNGVLGAGGNPNAALATANATLNVIGETGTQSVSIASGDSLNQIVSKINATTSTTGVKAVYDQLSDKLTIVSSQTGLAAKVQIQETTTTNILQNQLKIAPAATPTDTGLVTGQDALVSFNGGANVSVRSNSFTMNNMNFTLLADPAGTPYTVNGSNNTDVDTVVTTIKGIIDKYNSLIDNANGKLTETKYRDYPPLTDDQKKNMKDSDITLWEQKAKSGLLNGDSIISAGLDKMRLNLSKSVSGIAAGQYQSLTDIGITTAPSSGSSSYLAYQEKGKLYIDETKLRAALSTSPDQVAALFTKDGARDANGKLTVWNDAGIGTRLYETLKNDIVSGLTQKTQTVPSKSYLNKQIDDYASQISTAESGLSDYEQKLYSQYASMQKSLDKLNSQGSYLTSMFQSK